MTPEEKKELYERLLVLQRNKREEDRAREILLNKEKKGKRKRKKLKSVFNKKKPKTKKKKKKSSNSHKAAYNKYLQSPEWAIIKIEMRTFYGNKCQECGSKRKLHVHHKHYKNFGNEEPEDLMLVCEKCHIAIHKEWDKNKKK